MTAEGVCNWERRVGNGLGEDGEGRSWEIPGCGHNDVAGSRLRCSEKVNADTRDGSRVHHARRTKERPQTQSYHWLIYNLWEVKDWRFRPVSLESNAGCSPQSR